MAKVITALPKYPPALWGRETMSNTKRYTEDATITATERVAVREKRITDEFEKTRITMMPYWGYESPAEKSGKPFRGSLVDEEREHIAAVGEDAYNAALAAGDRKPLMVAYIRAAISVTMDFLPCVTNGMRDEWQHNGALKIIEESAAHVFLVKREPKKLIWRYIDEECYAESIELTAELKSVIETVLQILPDDFFFASSYSDAVIKSAMDWNYDGIETEKSYEQCRDEIVSMNRFELVDATLHGDVVVAKCANDLVSGAAAIRFVKGG